MAFVASCILIINFWSMIYNWHNAVIPFLIIPFIDSYVKVYRDYCDFPIMWMIVGIICGAVLIWSSTVIDARLGMWRSAVWTFFSGEASPTWETTGLLITGILCIASVLMARLSIGTYLSEPIFLRQRQYKQIEMESPTHHTTGRRTAEDIKRDFERKYGQSIRHLSGDDMYDWD